MGRALTVMLETIEDKPRKGALDVNTRDMVWQAFGSAGTIFGAAKGSYVMVGVAPERACFLRRPGATKNAGELRGGFEPDTVKEGARGSGLSEAGVAFTWTADKAIDL